MKRLLIAWVLSLAALIGGPASASPEREAYIEANLIAIFYHELAHAVIDIMGVPIYGQEEDAADVMSVLMIDRTFEEDDAQAIAYDSAFGFLDDPEGRFDVAFWGVHGPDEQRFYNHVCLFYGANPDARAALADDLGLPDDRAETCVEEYELAADSWSGVFEEMAAETSGEPVRFIPSSAKAAAFTNRIVAAEVQRANDEFSFPDALTVSVEDCGEANAFYDPDDVAIVMCTELAAHLQEMFETHWRQ